MEALLLILGLVALIPFLIAIRSFVLIKLWLWFICPVFGLRPLTLVEAAGLLLVVGFLFFEPSRHNKEPNQRQIFKSIVFPFITLLLGYLVHLFF